METRKILSLSLNLLKFQKDLIVWKRNATATNDRLCGEFQKDLIVWKPNYTDTFGVDYQVSEGLNSVETLYLLHIGWIVDLGFRRT